MKSLSASDKSALIRLAAGLPQGSTDRVAILAGLYKISVGGQYQDQWLTETGKKCTFHFRNQASADLWNDMCVGQISDGMWENTPNTGWRFWAEVQTAVGGSTKLEGYVPTAVVKTNFNFTSSELLEAVGGDMLEIVQKSEPSASMSDVIKYLKEIKAAMKGAEVTAPAPSGNAPSGLPEEADQKVAHIQMLKVCFDVAGQSPVNPNEIFSESFMFAPSGSRAGQYHYFLIFRTGTVCSAYGKFGRMPKGVLLGQNLQIMDARKLVHAKAKSKSSSGYEISTLAGIRNLMDPITGTVTHPHV